MSVTRENIKDLLDVELAAVCDPRVVSFIRDRLIEPEPVMLDWDYGLPGQQFFCWMVMRDAIIYCEYGFGPKCPWGLAGRAGSMGMDSGWFPYFMDAFFQSFLATDLPIWRIFQEAPLGTYTPLTTEGEWDAIWRKCERLKRTDPKGRYHVWHSISYDGRDPYYC